MTDNSQQNEFSSRASEEAPGLISEIFEFIRENKKWWLTPIVVALALLGFLVFLGSTGAAPFIYALF